MTDTLSEISENTKMARETALFGQFDTSRVYYQGVIQQIQKYLSSIKDPDRRRKWIQARDMICSEFDQVKEICDTMASFKSYPRVSAYNSYDNQEIGSPFGDYARNDHFSRHEEPTRDPDVWPPPTPVEHRPGPNYRGGGRQPVRKPEPARNRVAPSRASPGDRRGPSQPSSRGRQPAQDQKDKKKVNGDMICSECDQVKETCDTLASFKSYPRVSAYNSYDNQEIGSPFGDYARKDHYSRHEEPTRDPDVWPPPTPVEHRPGPNYRGGSRQPARKPEPASNRVAPSGAGPGDRWGYSQPSSRGRQPAQGQKDKKKQGFDSRRDQSANDDNSWIKWVDYGLLVLGVVCLVELMTQKN